MGMRSRPSLPTPICSPTSDDDRDMAINPDSISTSLGNDELLDEMDEFGYSGVDQVVEDEGHKEGGDLTDDAWRGGWRERGMG